MPQIKLGEKVKFDYWEGDIRTIGTGLVTGIANHMEFPIKIMRDDTGKEERFKRAAIKTIKR